MAQVAMDLLYSLTNCIFCFPGSPQLKVNNRSFKILRLLGEGGFSYVYLVQEVSTSTLYALKKIRCPFGAESVALALREAEAYALFSPHPHIIRAIDYAVVDARDRSDPGAKTVYILLPYYRRGNLQDAINANLVNRTSFPERRLVRLFLGIAHGLRAMHNYRVRGAPGGKDAVQRAGAVARVARKADDDADAERGQTRKGGGGGASGAQNMDEREAEPLMEDEADGGDAVLGPQAGVATGERRAYAHRDIKPGNIMIGDDGVTPIVMDLGSLAASPVAVTSRAIALQVQDQAAEHSTMPYRAPELFDVKTGSIVDAKVDVWSLGCTLYACLVGKSPFEARSEETGGSLSICVLGGDWRFPGEGKKGKAKANGSGSAGAKDAAGKAAEEDGISESVKKVVRHCLRVEPSERPDIDEVIKMLEDVITELPEEEGGED